MQPKSEIYQKMPMFEQLKDADILSYVMIYVIQSVFGAPLPCNFKNEILGSVPSIYTEVLK